MEIQYTLINSSLGRLLVARTDRGICAVYPGDTDAALERQLAEEFPRAERRKVATPFTEARQVRDALDKGAGAVAGVRRERHRFSATGVGGAGADPGGPDPHLRRGGEVDRAGGIGAGGGAGLRHEQRRGAGAVSPGVREDGGMGGYRWGLERKEELLGREGET